MKPRKTLEKILFGSKNIRFDDLTALVRAFGFRLSRISGSHHIFTHPDISELLNLQEVRGEAKPYQIRQFLRLVERYNLKLGRRRMKDYHINIFYSEEDGGYIADIPDLNACSAFGQTPDEALKEVQRARKAWLEAARKEGKPIPKARYRPAVYQLAS